MSKANNSEAGFTMIATLIGMVIVTAMALAAVTAVRGDIPLTSRDLASKKAYEAAKAGVEDYASHLYADSLYWTRCTGVPTPNAVNGKGSTTKRRSVPGEPNSSYAIELLPASNQTTYSQCSTANPGPSMLETSGPTAGSFRIRSTGFAGSASVPIVASFKRPSFLDYVYFTQLETLDPAAYGFANPSTQLTGAYSQCELTYEEGRQNRDIPGTNERCSTISFITGDTIEGPVHTNDKFSICGNPTFGRKIQDMVEIGANLPGWYGCSETTSNPTFVGTRVIPAPILVPPESNSKLASIALPQFTYTGQVRICLSGTTMTVGNGETCTGLYSGAIPSNGVIYVKNGACSTAYTPFNTIYNENGSPCGNAYVKGIYTGQLTIAAENDVVINGELCRTSCSSPSGEALLGLIANNFVRVYHPCSGGTLGSGYLKNPVIDAAILAIKHSFIVDNYNCGSPLEDLNVEGAIAQKFRGPVGTSRSGKVASGYTKDYTYDDRLRYLEPPSFIEPTGSAWVIGRETQG